MTDYQVKYPNLSSYQQTSNVILCARNRNFVVRSTDGITFTDVGNNSAFSYDDDFRRIYQLAYISSNTWMGIGYRVDWLDSNGTVRIYKTTDNGTNWSQQTEFVNTAFCANYATGRLTYPDPEI